MLIIFDRILEVLYEPEVHKARLVAASRSTEVYLFLAARAQPSFIARLLTRFDRIA